MRRLALSLLLLFPIAVLAQEEESQLRRNNSDWVSYPDHACIGGSTCTDRRLRIGLEDRPVLAVRFRAHDQIGTKAEGVLRLKIDGTTVKSSIDFPRSGETFTIDVDELVGRYVVFEPVTNDEVDISGVQVLYGRGTPRPRDPYRPGGGGGSGGNSGGGWRSYPRSAGCIGGNDCRRNGNRITIALEAQPVLGIRFFAHDNIGQRADGRLTVRIDNDTVASYIDVLRNGKRHDIDVDSIRGSRLVIETSNDDEVEIRDIEVLYGRGSSRRGGGSGWQREVTHEGGCIGGGECGGRRARIRVPIYGRSVAQIRFYARDDVGTRAGGELRIRIDDEIIQDYLDITREGRTYTFDGRGLSGDYLYFEPAEDDEVLIREIRVTFVND